jgi:PAS domain S-box-containing protein
MSLLRRVLLPMSLCGAVLVAYVAWGWLPGEPGTGVRVELAAVVAMGVAALLIVGGFALEAVILRPLSALAAQAQGNDEIQGLGQRLALLEGQLGERDAQLAQTLRQCTDGQAALRLAEERYALAVRSASDGLWEWNLQSDEVLLSPRWKSMLGYTDNELPDTRASWRERIHPDDRASAEAALQAHVTGASSRFEHQHRLLHKDGRFRWVLSRGAAIRHASGKAYRVVGLDIDITRIQRVESVLRELVEGTSGAWGEALFRAMVRHFAHALEVPFAFVTECTEHPARRVRTLAAWKDRGFVDNFEYDVAGTPCEAVVDGKTCFYPRGLATLFPREKGWESFLGVPILSSNGKVLGHLAFFDRREMPEDMLVDAIFKVFAARAGAEMERRHALDELRRLRAPVVLH